MKVTNLTIRAPRRSQPLLNSISLNFAPGRFTALVGPNGSGKSTLLRALTALTRYPLRLETGQIEYEGNDLLRLPHRSRARLISFMPQQPPQDVDFSVAEFISGGEYPWLGSGKSLPEVSILMERLRLASLAQQPFSRCSAGEKQKTLLARLLRQNTPVLLLDEPTANLDLPYQHYLGSLLKELAGDGRTVIAAVHNLDQALRYADDAVILKEGSVAGFGKSVDILSEEMISDVWGIPVLRGVHSRSGHLMIDPV